MRQYRTTAGEQHVVRGGGGLELHVREWGNASGPPILFIRVVAEPSVLGEPVPRPAR